MGNFRESSKLQYGDACLRPCSFCVNIPVLRPAAPHAHSPFPGHVPGVVLSFPSSCILKVSSNGFQFKIFYENNSLLPQSNQFFQLLLNLIFFKTPEIEGVKEKIKTAFVPRWHESGCILRILPFSEALSNKCCFLFLHSL